MKAHIVLCIVIAGSSLAANAQKMAASAPHLLVYKTKKNYCKYVPVILSDDKSKIISYPDPADIKRMGNDMRPTKLRKGYLMDNYGIGANTAYLDITIKEYAAMDKAPSTDELNKHILEKNPLTTLYDCGLKSNYSDPDEQIKKLIGSNTMGHGCKTIELNKD